MNANRSGIFRTNGIADCHTNKCEWRADELARKYDWPVWRRHRLRAVTGRNGYEEASAAARGPAKVLARVRAGRKCVAFRNGRKMKHTSHDTSHVGEGSQTVVGDEVRVGWSRGQPGIGSGRQHGA